MAAIAGIIMAPWGIRTHMVVDAVIPHSGDLLGGRSSGRGRGGPLVGIAWALRRYASEWSLLSMYVLLVAVVTVRARGLWGKKSVLEA